MSLNTADKIFLVVGLIDFGGIFLWIGICLHMAYTKMDLMLECFKKSSAVMTLVPLRHGGPWGKLLLIGGISGVVTFPGFYLKKGGLSPEDLRGVPAPLKRKFALLQWIGIWLVLVMVCMAAVVTLGLV
jgi:hypothetical protein